METLRTVMGRPLLAVGLGAATATFVLLVKLAFGASIWSQLRVWPVFFLAITCTFIVALAFSRRWIEASIAGGLTVIVTFAAWRFAIPIYAAIGGYEGAVIIPVAP